MWLWLKQGCSIVKYTDPDFHLAVEHPVFEPSALVSRCLDHNLHQKWLPVEGRSRHHSAPLVSGLSEVDSL